MTTETFNASRSSFISQIEWTDEDDSYDGPVLTVSFTDGFVGRYLDVPYTTYRSFTLAPSAGQFFHRRIKDTFEYEPG